MSNFLNSLILYSTNINIILAIFFIVCGALFAFFGKELWTKGSIQIEEYKALPKIKPIQASKKDFDIIVEILESQLVSQGAQIIKFVPIQDKITQEFKTVPLLIKEKGIHEINIAIETKENVAPEGTEWIQTLISKYQYMDVQKVILVSKQGFTSEARKLAEINKKIELLSFGEATNRNWHDIFNKLKLVTVNYTHPPKLEAIRLLDQKNHDLTAEPIKDLSGWTLIEKEDIAPLSLQETIEAFIYDSTFLEKYNKQMDTFLLGKKYLSPPPIEFQEEVLIKSPQGKTFKPAKLLILIEGFKESEKVLLEQASYGDANVYLGKANLKDSKIHVVFSSLNGSSQASFFMEGNNEKNKSQQINATLKLKIDSKK